MDTRHAVAALTGMGAIVSATLEVDLAELVIIPGWLRREDLAGRHAAQIARHEKDIRVIARLG